jgi:hypothetical protein
MPVGSIRIMCPNLTCKKILAVPETARGKTVRCKGCATCIRIPDKTPTAPKPDKAQAKAER